MADFSCSIVMLGGSGATDSISRFYRSTSFRSRMTATSNYYETINITNARFAKDFTPINKNSVLPELQKYLKPILLFV